MIQANNFIKWMSRRKMKIALMCAQNSQKRKISGLRPHPDGGLTDPKTLSCNYSLRLHENSWLDQISKNISTPEYCTDNIVMKMFW